MFNVFVTVSSCQKFKPLYRGIIKITSPPTLLPTKLYKAVSAYLSNLNLKLLSVTHHSVLSTYISVLVGSLNKIANIYTVPTTYQALF